MLSFYQKTHCTNEVAKVWEAEWGGKLFYSEGLSNACWVVTLIRKNLV